MTLVLSAEPRCRLCRGKLGRKRCRICDKGEIPAPGGPAWGRWSRGLTATVRERLDTAGLGRLALDACRALILDDIAMPEEAAPLLLDIAQLPICVRLYRRAINRAMAEHNTYIAARSLGLTGRAADSFAAETADAWMARVEARPRVHIEPERIRVDVARLEIAVDDMAPEHEAEAHEEAARAAGARR